MDVVAPLNHKEVYSFRIFHKEKVLEATNCVLEVGVQLNGLRITRLEEKIP